MVVEVSNIITDNTTTGSRSENGKKPSVKKVTYVDIIRTEVRTNEAVETHSNKSVGTTVIDGNCALSKLPVTKLT